MKKRYLNNLFLAALLLSSCHMLIQDEFPDFEDAPVVLCFLREGEPLELRLSWTAKMGDSPLRYIEDAQVRLFVDGTYAETLVHRAKGIYDAETVVASTVRYRCEIVIPGFGTVAASDSLPAPVAPFDAQIIPVSLRDEEGAPIPAIRFTFANNPAERRYFEAAILEVVEEYEYVDTEWGYPRRQWTGEYILSQVTYFPQFTDPVLKSEGLQIPVFSNEHIRGNEYTMTINYGVSYSGDNDGGGWIWTANIEPTILELRSVSYDYYRYAKQRHLYEQGFGPVFGKPAPVFNLFSNIDKGYGIFAGYSAMRSDTLEVR